MTLRRAGLLAAIGLFAAACSGTTTPSGVGLPSGAGSAAASVAAGSLASVCETQDENLAAVADQLDARAADSPEFDADIVQGRLNTLTASLNALSLTDATELGARQAAVAGMSAVSGKLNDPNMDQNLLTAAATGLRGADAALCE